MRIGNRVSVRPGCTDASLMEGKIGTIIRAEPGEIGDMVGRTSLTIQFDEPVIICGQLFGVCGGFKEEELELIL